MHDLHLLFKELRLAIEQQDRKKTATLFARLASLAMAKRSWGRATILLLEAQRSLPESSKLLLALGICEWEKKNEREAKKRMHALARTVLRRQRLKEYSALIETELQNYPGLRQSFYEAVASVERNSALPFLGLAKVSANRKDWTKAVEYLIDGLKSGDAEGRVLKELEAVLSQSDIPGHEALLVQVERYRARALTLDDLCVLLTAPVAVLGEESSNEEDLSEMIEKLEEELGSEEPEGGGWDKVGPLLTEFRRRAHPVIGKDTQSRLDLALAFFEMKLYSASRDELREVGETDPLYPKALCLLGQIHLAESAWLQALEVYQAVLRCDLSAAPDTLNEAEYQLIRIYVKLEDFGKAMIHIRNLEKRVADYRDIRRMKDLVASRLGVEKMPTRLGKKLQKAG